MYKIQNLSIYLSIYVLFVFESIKTKMKNEEKVNFFLKLFFWFSFYVFHG